MWDEQDNPYPWAFHTTNNKRNRQEERDKPIDLLTISKGKQASYSPFSHLYSFVTETRQACEIVFVPQHA
jgi:hypothetical protein